MSCSLINSHNMFGFIISSLNRMSLWFFRRSYTSLFENQLHCIRSKTLYNDNGGRLISTIPSLETVMKRSGMQCLGEQISNLIYSQEGKDSNLMRPTRHFNFPNNMGMAVNPKWYSYVHGTQGWQQCVVHCNFHNRALSCTKPPKSSNKKVNHCNSQVAEAKVWYSSLEEDRAL